MPPTHPSINFLETPLFKIFFSFFFSTPFSLTSFLESLLAGKPLVLHDLDPVSVGVQQERDVPHPAVGEPLLPVRAEGLEARARGVEVVDGDACGKTPAHVSIPSGFFFSVLGGMMTGRGEAGREREREQNRTERIGPDGWVTHRYAQSPAGPRCHCGT